MVAPLSTFRNWPRSCPVRPAMPIHVRTTAEDSRTVLKVDGRLRREDVDELVRAFRSAQGSVALDLTELQSADHAGVETLRQLMARDVEVRGISPYIALLLKDKA